MPTATDPAKRGIKRSRIEREMLDILPGGKRASPAHRAIDGIDRTFLFGNVRHLVLTRGAPHSPAFGGYTGKPGLRPFNSFAILTYV